jgi:hypothetical protein
MRTAGRADSIGDTDHFHHAKPGAIPHAAAHRPDQ